MGRNIGPTTKISRRFGINLGLKTNSVKVAKRLSQPPGTQGPKKRGGPASGFGKQLAEKQKAKFIFGLREAQFSKYVKEAARMTGDSSVNLQQLLERRLDNVVYKFGFAITRAQARQMVGHKLFLVNGKSMNVPSYLVKIGDIVELKTSKTKSRLFEGLEERMAKLELPSWLTLDLAKKSGKILGTPADADFEKSFDTKLIIEYYSTR
jgi:small subunit ribosomal protein S4